MNRSFASTRRRLWLASLLACLAGTTAVAEYGSAGASGGDSPVRALQATTSSGRQGAYYLPRDHAARPLPLLVFLHGTGGKGSTALLRFRALAERERFIAVAPDSVSTAGVWLVQHGTTGKTEDHLHVVNCVREVLALPGVRLDRAQVLIAGFSMGGGAAFYLATHEGIFSAFAVLHGHIVSEGMGPRRVPGWLSTGDRDRVRTTEHMRSAAEHLTRRWGFPDLVTRVFRGDHTLGDEELGALIAWWRAR